MVNLISRHTVPCASDRTESLRQFSVSSVESSVSSATSRGGGMLDDDVCQFERELQEELVCRWCWSDIRHPSMFGDQCPTCNSHVYDKPIATHNSWSASQTDQKSQNKARSKSEYIRGADRRAMQNLRVIQHNLVYAIGLSPNMANINILKLPEYFGQYGEISKVAINHHHGVSPEDPRYGSASAYITFARKEDAWASIRAVNGFRMGGRTIRASFGTTKYCNSFLRNLPCNNPDCLYLHELGEEADRFTKDEVQVGLARHGSSFAFREDILESKSESSSDGSKNSSAPARPTVANPVLPPPTSPTIVPRPVMADGVVPMANVSGLASSTPSVVIGLGRANHVAIKPGVYDGGGLPPISRTRGESNNIGNGMILAEVNRSSNTNVQDDRGFSPEGARTRSRRRRGQRGRRGLERDEWGPVSKVQSEVTGGYDMMDGSMWTPTTTQRSAGSGSSVSSVELDGMVKVATESGNAYHKQRQDDTPAFLKQSDIWSPSHSSSESRGVKFGSFSSSGGASSYSSSRDCSFDKAPGSTSSLLLTPETQANTPPSSSPTHISLGRGCGSSGRGVGATWNAPSYAPDHSSGSRLPRDSTAIRTLHKSSPGAVTHQVWEARRGNEEEDMFGLGSAYVGGNRDRPTMLRQHQRLVQGGGDIEGRVHHHHYHGHNRSSPRGWGGEQARMPSPSPPLQQHQQHQQQHEQTRCLTYQRYNSFESEGSGVYSPTHQEQHQQCCRSLSPEGGYHSHPRHHCHRQSDLCVPSSVQAPPSLSRDHRHHAHNSSTSKLFQQRQQQQQQQQQKQPGSQSSLSSGTCGGNGVSVAMSKGFNSNSNLSSSSSSSSSLLLKHQQLQQEHQQLQLEKQHQHEYATRRYQAGLGLLLPTQTGLQGPQVEGGTALTAPTTPGGEPPPRAAPTFGGAASASRGEHCVDYCGPVMPMSETTGRTFNVGSMALARYGSAAPSSCGGGGGSNMMSSVVSQKAVGSQREEGESRLDGPSYLSFGDGFGESSNSGLSSSLFSSSGSFSMESGGNSGGGDNWTVSPALLKFRCSRDRSTRTPPGVPSKACPLLWEPTMPSALLQAI